MTIDINNESTHEIELDAMRRLAEYVFSELHLHPETDLGVLLVEEPAMSDLHEKWMNEPGPTDVLSFPMDELHPGRPDQVTPQGILGDLVICPSVAERQAESAGHSVLQEVLLLETHGLLHLLGFDHATPAEEAEMFQLQNQLLIGFARSAT